MVVSELRRILDAFPENVEVRVMIGSQANARPLRVVLYFMHESEQRKPDEYVPRSDVLLLGAEE